MTNNAPRRLSDIRNSNPSILIEGFVGQDITVLSFEELESGFGEEGTKYVVMTCDTQNGANVRIRTGAAPVMKTLKENANDMPFVATVRKLGRTFILE